MRRAAAPLLLAGALLCACGPWGPKGVLPGGPFLGLARPLPTDASFADAQSLIAIETRDGWLRHTVTILCVVADGRLYVMARHAPTKRWVRDVLADPRVRLEIGGRIYAGRAVRVDGSPDDDARIAHAFLRKYVGVDVERARFLAGPPPEGDDRAEVWSFRIDPPGDAS